VNKALVCTCRTLKGARTKTIFVCNLDSNFLIDSGVALSLRHMSLLG